MDLTSRQIVKSLLQKHDIRPSKRLGQNFLIDKQVLQKILKAAGLEKNDIVLEIGPGIGTLTKELAKRTKQVIAVEKDKKMVEILKELLECWNVRNVKVVEADILKIPLFSNLLPNTYKLVANLPYYIVSPVIRKFLETEVQPQLMVLMVQKEVAQRIMAKPPRMNLLAISVQFYSAPEIVSYVSKKCFWPQPKVDGAIIRIPRIATNLPQIDTNLFFKIVKAGFAHPRKLLVNNLCFVLKLEKGKVRAWLEKNRIDPSQRAQALKVEDWINLTKTCIINQ